MENLFSDENSRKIIEEKIRENQKNAEQRNILNNFAVDEHGLKMNVFANESSAVALLLKMLNLAPSKEEFTTVILPWLQVKLPYLYQTYESNKEFFDVMAPKVVGAATIGIGIYKLKNYLSSYFGFSKSQPGARKRGRPRKYEYVE
jgi:hypothetical protein